MPEFSVIIPTLNEKNYIRSAINSVRQQSFSDLEIVIVDNYSSDNTVDLCKGADKILKYALKQSPGAARNYGAKNSDSRYLVFLDADSSLSPTAVQNAKNIMDKGYIGGRNILMSPEKKLLAIIQTSILNNWANHISPQYTPYLFCTREAFNKVGGWDEEVKLGDELVIQRKLSTIGKLKFDSNSFVCTSPRRYQKEGYLKATLLGILGYCGMKVEWKPIRD